MTIKLSAAEETVLRRFNGEDIAFPSDLRDNDIENLYTRLEHKGLIYGEKRWDKAQEYEISLNGIEWLRQKGARMSDTKNMDEPINVVKELAEAQQRFPLAIPDKNDVGTAVHIRTIALTIAQRHVGDTVIKDGVLYQQLKIQGVEINHIKIDDVINAALVFERYLWGEYSRGIAENALNATLTEAADILEEEFNKYKKGNLETDDSVVADK